MANNNNNNNARHPGNEEEDDYYAVLGVSKQATEKEIRLAYRRLAVATPPDKRPAEEREIATKEFTAVGEAYEVLSDPEKRAIYDRFGKAGLSGNGQFTPEMAMKMYWDFFRPPGWERGADGPSKSHGAYVALAGGFSAPVKGLAAGGALAATAVVAGGVQAVGGVVSGAKEFHAGVRQAVTGKAPPPPPPRPSGEDGVPEGTEQMEEDNVGAVRRMARVVTRPAGGALAGVLTAGAGALAGGGVMLTGGLGGAVMNMKEGGREFAEAWRRAPAPGNDGGSEAAHTQAGGGPLLLKDQELATVGKFLFASSMSADSFADEIAVHHDVEGEEEADNLL